MKTNYDFPYQFWDLTSSGECYLEATFENTELILTIDLGAYVFNEKIDIILEVESTQTFFRKIFVLSESINKIKINYDQLGSKVDYSLLLVSKQEGIIELNGFSDYYEFGDCVGLLEKSSIPFSEEESFSGLIKVARSSKDIIAYDLTSEWITIELPQETYERFHVWQKDDSTTPFVLASLGNSCVQFAIITALKDEGYKEKKWWETIMKLLADKGYDSENLEECEIPGAANKILGNCIQEMVNTATHDADHEFTGNLA